MAVCIFVARLSHCIRDNSRTPFITIVWKFTDRRKITALELLFKADESAYFDLFVETSMASSTAVKEELLVSVGFNCGNRVKNTVIFREL